MDRSQQSFAPTCRLRPFVPPLEAHRRRTLVLPCCSTRPFLRLRNFLAAARPCSHSSSRNRPAAPACRSDCVLTAGIHPYPPHCVPLENNGQGQGGGSGVGSFEDNIAACLSFSSWRDYSHTRWVWFASLFFPSSEVGRRLPTRERRRTLSAHGRHTVRFVRRS
ncbi:hypothetical protein B0H17DRAFT_1342424 [Mycena rosella]|uniref:Uncharacterized protein n=1 Tax=Mycena rosella TaxID=1033263 RepID=A0AAD7AWH5_MYCRO|nr:hypothetical protein B0H17DRAFT_1342424 [Mycena rosella]